MHFILCILIPSCVAEKVAQFRFATKRNMPIDQREYDTYMYCYAVVIVIGILGNILVVLSIRRQKHLLKKNYYFLVLHLAICDVSSLIIFLLDTINSNLLEGRLVDSSEFRCLGIHFSFFFQTSGLGMMLIISVLRYRAIVHPLYPATDRRKLKVVCGLVYVAGFAVGYGPAIPLCFLNNSAGMVYYKYLQVYIVICFLFSPTLFMAVVYFRIGRTLAKKDKHIKSLYSDQAVRRSAASSFVHVVTYFRDRKTFIICLLTVLCYGVANIPLTVRIFLIIAGKFRLQNKYHWILNYCCSLVQVVGWHSANPLIYGILDRQMLKFGKLRRN